MLRRLGGWLMLMISMAWAQHKYVPGQVLVQVTEQADVPALYKFADSQNSLPGLDALQAEFGLLSWEKIFTDTSLYPEPELQRCFLLRHTPGVDSLRLLKAVKGLKWVSVAELNVLFPPMYKPSEYEISAARAKDLYYLDLLRAPEAWDIYMPGLDKLNTSVIIAVVDDGCNIYHTDLLDNLWINTKEIPGNNIDDDKNGYIDDLNGFDTYDNDPDVFPPATHQHGSHVAGLAAARTDNFTGIASPSFNPLLMPVKGAGDAGSGIEGYFSLKYAIDNKAHIVNMSFGAIDLELFFQKLLIQTASNNKGMIFVGGAGNDGKEANFLPAAYSSVVAVSSVEADSTMSGYSNWGTWVDVLSPGSGIYSSMNNGENSYGYMWGTSMATPLVSACLGLMKAYRPNATRDELLHCLYASGKSVEHKIDPKYTGKVGHGLVQLDSALRCLQQTVLPPTISTGKTLSSHPDLKVYPNPASTHLYVELPDNTHTGTLEILDLQGRNLYSQLLHTGGSIAPIALPDLAQGTYLLRLATPSGVHQALWQKL